MTTIKDIANLAQVSASTVSNVLHGRTNKVSPEVQQRVQKALQEKNYTSNMGARMLARHGSKLIGVIIHTGLRADQSPMQNPFFSVLLGALEENIRNAGYYMMVYTSSRTDESLRMAAGWNVEGLILLGYNGEDCREMYVSTQAPVVFIDSYHDTDDDRYYNVGLRDRSGGYIMAQYLIGQGHRNIAFLADADVPVGVDCERFQGVKEAMEEHDLPCTMEQNYIAVCYGRQARREQLKANIAMWMQNYTVLFYASDLYASEAIGYLHDFGIRVPEQISIAGFDGNLCATLCRPTLTTISQNIPMKAKIAVDVMLDRLRGETPEKHNFLLANTLYVQNSTKDVAQRAETLPQPL